ncbi:MAG TPA: NADPH-dependent F420 reductase [Candidatus Caenarcaniphilales bacterium]
MKIGIMGAGNVGSTLGRIWAQTGHAVVFGVRDPESDKVRSLLANMGSSAKTGTIAQAALHADVVALTVPWEAVPEVLQPASDLDGKILLDCTNPLIANQVTGSVNQSISGGEQVAAWVPKAHVVKIFNTVGFESMADPQYGTEVATMFYAGDDAQAKSVAAQLAKEVGFDPIDVGPLSNAKFLESLTLLWGQLVYKQGMGRNIALRLLKR